MVGTGGLFLERAVRWGSSYYTALVKIATWNINGMGARLEFVLHWLRERQPDLVGLQELKMEDDKFPHAEFEAAGYQAVTHGQKAWNGVAILGRKQVEVTQTWLPGQEDFGARLITADTGEMSFTTVYCPNGKHVEHDDFPRKLAWFDALREHFEDQHDAGRPTVLCGDFNICPTPMDSWKDDGNVASIFHTQEERQRYRSLLDWGFRDVFRERYPDQETYSWWDYRGGAFHRGMGLRLDFILGTKAVKVDSIEVDREYRKKKEGITASDHAPVVCDVR